MVDIGCEHNLLVLFMNRLGTIIVPIKTLSDAMCSFGKTAIILRGLSFKLACVINTKEDHDVLKIFTDFVAPRFYS